MTDPALQQLNALLAQCGYTPEVVLLKSHTTSTNDDILQLYQQFPQLNSALICSEQQSQGRGQHQRTWISPQGNLYFSCLAQLNQPVNGRFSLEVALSILNSATLTDFPLKVKWANDLYSQYGKFGGILIEPMNTTTMIVGIGINLYPVETQQDVFYPITSLTELNIPFERLKLISELYHAVQQAVQWFNYGSQNLIQRFQHHAYLLGENIQFEHLDGITQGKYIGINADGALGLLNDEQKANYYYQGRIILNQSST